MLEPWHRGQYPDYVLDSHWNENEAYSGMLRLLSPSSRPPPVLSLQLQHGGWRSRAGSRSRASSVPDDISLVSFDDVPLFRLHEAGITAIAQPVAQDRLRPSASILTTRLSDRTGRAHAPHTITLDCDIILAARPAAC